MDIFAQISSEIKEFNSTLVLVTKTKSAELISEYYNRGHRDFGENKVQELLPKYDTLPKDIRWHFIGHLQKNKVKYIAPFVNLIHSVDSLELLEEINDRGLKNERIIGVLLEIKIADEFTKYGLSEEECVDLIANPVLKTFHNIRIKGLMGMASFVDDEKTIKKEFESLKDLYVKLKSRFFSDSDEFCELSMGMSGDYKIALDCGSTMVRIGSLILGSRK